MGVCDSWDSDYRRGLLARISGLGSLTDLSVRPDLVFSCYDDGIQ